MVKKILKMTLFFTGMMMLIDPVFADLGGLQDKGTNLLEGLSAVLKAFGSVVMGLCFGFCGYKWMVQRAQPTDLFRIAGGGVLVGGGQVLAGYIMEFFL